MRLSALWCSPLVALVACDYDAHEGAADADAADGGEVSTYTSALGADPESGMMIEGELAYSPEDAHLARLAEAVVIGATRGPAGVHVVHGPGGPRLVGPGEATSHEPAVLIAPAASAPHAPTGDALPEVAGGRWVVSGGRPILAEGEAVDLAWARRAPDTVARGPEAGWVFVARLETDVDRLPPAIQKVLDATVRVFDGEREVCLARVTGFHLEASLVHEPLGPWDPTYSEVELFARGRRVLVADLAPLGADAGACAAGVVAVGVDAPSPRLFREVDAPPALVAQARAELCRALATSIEAAPDEGGGELLSRSACRERLGAIVVRAFEGRGGARFTTAQLGDLHAGFAPRGKHLDLAWSYRTSQRAEALIDVQDDGSPELLLAPAARAPRALVGAAFAGDARAPTFTPDWRPVAPTRAALGGHAVPDFSVFVE